MGLKNRGKLLTPKKVNELYGVDTQKIYYWIRNKRFNFIKPDKEILFWESDFLRFLDKFKVEIEDEDE